MNIFRRVFSNREPSFSIQLEDGASVPATVVATDVDPNDVLDAHRFIDRPSNAIFITGGASNMSEEDQHRTRLIFEEGIAPFAQEHNITVIDGATQSGVIEMMAMARKKGNYTFPLIGIAPHGQVKYEGHNRPGEIPLCPGHSHFIFVDSNDFGAESRLIITLANAIACAKGRPTRVAHTLGIVINGGQITRNEVYMATTDELNIPLIVLEGSGRFADELARATRTGKADQTLLREVVRRGNIQVVGTPEGANGMQKALRHAFEIK